jgi:transposase
VGKVFVGHDWAEAHHDVHIEDEQGHRLAKARLPEGMEGVARFHQLVAPFVEDPAEVVIATETDRGLFVGALVAAGYTVLAINPMSTSRYRERHSTSGAKSDPGDALVLAELARTDAHNHRPVAGDSDLAEAVKVLARAHQSMIWTRQRQTNQLRSTLREFYPGALTCFDDLHGGDALAVLAVAPTPVLGRGLSRSKIAAALRRGGRQRRVGSAPRRSRPPCAPISWPPPTWSRRPWGPPWPPWWASSRSSAPRSADSRRAWPTVLRSTRPPRSSAPCQDWG